MKCKNCGASYPDRESKCSFCGAENRSLFERNKQKKIDALHQETIKIRNLPKKIVKKSTYVLLKAGIIFVLCVFLICTTSFFLTKIREDKKYNNHQLILLELEKIYLSENYDNLYHYLKEKELWQNEYLKYSQVADVYHYYQNIQENLQESIDKNKTDKDTLSYLLENSYKAMKICKEATQDKAVLGNEHLLDDIQKQISSVLQNNCRLKPDEINQFQALDSLDQENLTLYTEQIIERIQ